MNDPDPEMRRFEPEEEWIECPRCHTVMLPLREYEIQAISEAPSVDEDIIGLVIWGWWIFVLNYVYDLMTYAGRKRKLELQKKSILPRFPASLVCPRCAHIIERLAIPR